MNKPADFPFGLAVQRLRLGDTLMLPDGLRLLLAAGAGPVLEAQLLDAGGQPLAAPAALAPLTADGLVDLQALPLPDGGVAVAWRIDDATPARLQVLDAGGQPVGAARTLAFDGGFELQRDAASSAGFAVVPAAAPVVALDGGSSTDDQPVGGAEDAGGGVGTLDITAPTPLETGERIVNSWRTGDALEPEVAVLADGGWVVVWQSNGQDGSGDGVYFQRFAADGSAVGPETRVNTQTTSEQEYPHVAALSTGGFVIVWQDNSALDGSSWSVVAQRYDAAGAAQGTNFIVNTTTSGGQYHGVVAAYNGGFAVAYAADAGPSGSSSADVYLKRFDNAGNVTLDQTRLSTLPANPAAAQTGNQYYPEISARTDGSLVVAWEDQGSNDGSLYGVYSRTVAADNTLGGVVLVNTTVSGYQYEPSVAFLDGGGYVVVWRSDGQDGSGGGVFAQRFRRRRRQAGQRIPRQRDDCGQPVHAGGAGPRRRRLHRRLVQRRHLRRHDLRRADPRVQRCRRGRRRTAQARVADQLVRIPAGARRPGRRALHRCLCRLPAGGCGRRQQLRHRHPDLRQQPHPARPDDRRLRRQRDLRRERGQCRAAGAGCRGQRDRPRLGQLRRRPARPVRGERRRGHRPARRAQPGHRLRPDRRLGRERQLRRRRVRHALGRRQRQPARGAVQRQRHRRRGGGAGPEPGLRQHLAEPGGRPHGGRAHDRRRRRQQPGRPGHGERDRRTRWQARGPRGRDRQHLHPEPAIRARDRGAGRRQLRRHLVLHRPGRQRRRHLLPALRRQRQRHRRRAARQRLHRGRTELRQGGRHRRRRLRDRLARPEWAGRKRPVDPGAALRRGRRRPRGQLHRQQLRQLHAGHAGGGRLRQRLRRRLVLHRQHRQRQLRHLLAPLRPGRQRAGRRSARVTPAGTATGAQAGAQYYPAIDAYANGNLVVVWHDSGSNDGSGYGVYGRLYNAASGTFGNTFLVNTTTSGQQSYPNTDHPPKVATLVDGGFVVVWSSDSNDASGWAAMGQRFDGAGNKVGAEFRVSETVAGSQYQVDVTGLSSGGFVVTFYNDNYDVSGTGTTADVYIREYDAAGNAIDGQRKLEDPSNSTQQEPAIADLGNGNFVVAYAGTMTTAAGGNGTYEIRQQLFGSGAALVRSAAPTLGDFTGTVVFDENLVNAAPQVIDAAVSFSDADSANLAGGRLDLFYVQYGEASDQLGVRNQGTGAGQIGVSGSTVSYSGTAIGTIAGGSNGANLVITFNANATVDAVEALVQNLTFASTSQNPAATRTVGLRVSDGDGGTSDSSTVTIQVTPALDGKPVAWGEERVNTYTTSNQTDPEVAAFADGSYVIAWASTGQDGSGEGVYFQRFQANGRPVGPEQRANTSVSGEQSYAHVATLSNGGFVVVWQGNDSTDGSGWGVIGQRYDASGIAQGGNFVINTTTSSTQYHGTVASYTGGFAVAWTSTGNAGGSGYDVYLKRYDNTGAVTLAETRISTIPGAPGSAQTSTQELPDIAARADGSLVLVWQDLGGNDSNSYGVYARTVSAAGVLGDTFLVNTSTTGAQYEPSVAVLDGGGFVVVWRSDVADGNSAAVLGQRFDAAGNKVGAEFLVNETTVGGQYQPAVTGVAGGGFIVSFYNDNYDLTGAGTSADVYIREYDAAGNAIDGQRKLGSVSNSTEWEPAIAHLGNGNFVVAYSDYATAASGGNNTYGIAQQIFGSGAALARQADP